MLNRSASLAMSTSVLKALPGKLDIKRHSPSILYNYTDLEISQPEGVHCNQCVRLSVRGQLAKMLKTFDPLLYS